MAKVHVSIVHDEIGRILSVARPTNPSRVIVGGGSAGVFETEVEEDSIPDLVSGRQRVDAVQRRLVDPGSAK